jgi:hypothetical protein
MNNFLRALLAIMLGNLLYFALMSYLPTRLHHAPFRMDWGLVLDFGLCVAAYIGIRLFTEPLRRPRKAKP